MGASKRMGEHLVLGHARTTCTRYSAVRFGNVLGSRGSVIPTFARQIAKGGPVTVTDPRMTRYFMTTPEAVQLVLQAAALSDGGDVLMLEMGEPANIFELAKRMIRLTGREVGRDIAIEFVGCRPGEKLHEELSAPDEEQFPTDHPSIVRLDSVAMSANKMTEVLAGLHAAAHGEPEAAARRLLFAAIGTTLPPSMALEAEQVELAVTAPTADRETSVDVDLSLQSANR
jgi:FlaA1/EpsC-like NDP-sugar epimerase